MGIGLNWTDFVKHTDFSLKSFYFIKRLKGVIPSMKGYPLFLKAWVSFTV